MIQRPRPTFDNDPKLRAACAERCADESGDPPCWEVVDGCAPCGECLRDVGYEPGDELDPDAVVAPLL